MYFMTMYILGIFFYCAFLISSLYKAFRSTILGFKCYTNKVEVEVRNILVILELARETL